MTAQQTAVLKALAQVLGVMPASAKISRKTKAAAKAIHTPFDSQAAIDRECKRRGFVAPGVAHENVLTYGKQTAAGTTGWLAKGRRVKTGEKALKIGTLRLFHEEQTEVIPVA